MTPRINTIAAVLSVAVLFVSSLIVAAQPKLDVLDEVVPAELRETHTPGAAIAIISGGRAIRVQGYGAANIETNDAVKPETLFRIGSMTKMFTSLTLLSLANDGSVRLQEPIGKYVSGLSARIAAITLRQLLVHASGIRDEGSPYGPHDETALASAARSIDDSYLFTEPGAIFSYSNLNYLLLGAAIEQIAGRPYAEVVNARVLKPLGMTRSTFRPTEAMTWPLSQGHDIRAGRAVVVRPFTDNVGGWPAGFLFSSASDLARLAMALTDGGVIEGKQVLPRAVVDQLTQDTIEIPGIGVRYGYGMRIETMRGVEVSGHGGAIPGFGSQIVYSKTAKTAIIILTNVSGGRLEKTLDAALEATLTVTPKTAAARPVVLSATRSDLESLPGVYVHSPRQSFEIAVKDGRLYLKDEDDLVPLEKIALDHFQMPGRNEPEDVVFVPGQGGIEYLHINGRAFKRRMNK